MRCPRCGGRGRVIIDDTGRGFFLKEGPCPLCSGIGAQSSSTGAEPSLGDILTFSITTAVAWAFGGMFTAIALYYNPSGTPTIVPTPAHLTVLGKILTIWGVCGFLLGLVALFDFMTLASAKGPVSAFPVHLMHMSLTALVVGALVGGILYGVIDPPPSAIVRSMAWRLPVCCITSLVATNLAIRIIPKVPRLFS